MTTHNIAYLLLTILSVASQHVSAAPSSEVTTFMVRQNKAPTLYLSRTVSATKCTKPRTPVLYIHGATFPSELSISYEIDKQSWADNLADNCFAVWALDFAGYGHSERYSPQNRAGFDANVPGRSAEAAAQIARAVDHIIQHEFANTVSIIAHSWGTMPAGYYAAKAPEKVERLILFGPVAVRNNPPNDLVLPKTQFVTPEKQQKRFLSETPIDHPPVLALRPFSNWGNAYLASDPLSYQRTPASVEVPNGPGADVLSAWSGTFPYNPADIISPVMIVRGEWDTVTTDADAHWLYSAFASAPVKRDVKIDRAGHLMHLEDKRRELYAVTASFLMEGKTRD